MSSFQNSQEEFVAIPLDTPDRRIVQTLLQFSQHPSISDFSTSDSHGQSSFQSNSKPHFQKKPFFSNPKPKQKNNNRNWRPQNQHFNNHNQRNSPFPSRSPHKVPHFNNFNKPSNVSAPADEMVKLDLSHPFVSLILLAALKNSQNATINAGNNPHPQFEYSSNLNNNQKFSVGKTPRSPSPGKFLKKKVHWADESPFRNSNWQMGYSSGSKSKRNNSRSNSRGSSYDSQRSHSKNHWNGGNKAAKGILKQNNNQRYNNQKKSPFQKGSVSKIQYPGSVPKLDFSKGSVPKINPTTLIGKRSAPPVTGAGAEGHWECPYPRCRAINLSNESNCTNCGIIKPKNTNRSGPAFKKGDWNCPSCSNLNFARRSDCNVCQTQRPAESYDDFRPRKIVKTQVATPSTPATPATAAEEKVEEKSPPHDDIKWNVLEEGELEAALNLFP